MIGPPAPMWRRLCLIDASCIPMDKTARREDASEKIFSMAGLDPAIQLGSAKLDGRLVYPTAALRAARGAAMVISFGC